MSEQLTLITVQNKKVLDILQKNWSYFSRARNEYSSLVNILNLEFQPIFCSALNHNTNLFGCELDDLEDFCILELNVPKSYTKFTEYYIWTDYMFFTDEDPDYAGILSGELRKQLPITEYGALQVILDRIQPDWFVASYPLTQDFVNEYCGNGGNTAITRQTLDSLKTNLFV